MAWRIPPVWNDLQSSVIAVPEGSRVPQKQENLIKATEAVLQSIAADVRTGLFQTVGVGSHLSIADGLSSMILELPPDTDAVTVAEAIDAENVESWTDNQGQVHIAINPWYSTKDVDQTVLSAIKIIHVLLGMHASDSEHPKSLKERFVRGVMEIIELRNNVKKP